MPLEEVKNIPSHRAILPPKRNMDDDDEESGRNIFSLWTTNYSNLRGGFGFFFMFFPTWRNDPIWLMLKNGLVQPPTRDPRQKIYEFWWWLLGRGTSQISENHISKRHLWPILSDQNWRNWSSQKKASQKPYKIGWKKVPAVFEFNVSYPDLVNPQKKKQYPFILKCLQKIEQKTV